MAQILRGSGPPGSTHTPGYSARRPAVEAERGERVDHELLDVADVGRRPEACWRSSSIGVADQLTRTVVRDVSAAPDADEVGAHGGRGRSAGCARGRRTRPVREHVGVLEQQAGGASWPWSNSASAAARAPHGTGRCRASECAAVWSRSARYRPAVGSRRGRNSSDQSRVSRISLTPRQESRPRRRRRRRGDPTPWPGCRRDGRRSASPPSVSRRQRPVCG